MNIGGIPIFEERRERTLESYTGHSFSGVEISIELTENEIYLGFKKPIHYREITGIYRKIKENPNSKDYLDVFTGSSQWFRIYEPDLGLADSIIEEVTGAKKKTEHNNNRQTDINNIASKIKEAMGEKTSDNNSEYRLPNNIQRKIKEITGDEVHNLGSKRGMLSRQYKDPVFAAGGLLMGLGTDKEIKIISQNTAFYSFREVASNGQGPKSKKTWLEIYNIETPNTECPTPEIISQYFNRKKAIELMRGKI